MNKMNDYLNLMCFLFLVPSKILEFLTSLNAFTSKGRVTVSDGTLCLLRKFTKPLKFLFKCIAIIIELSLLCLNDVVHVSVLCF